MALPRCDTWPHAVKTPIRDLILLLILSNAVQNSMNAGDNSLIGGLISAITLIVCHMAMAHLSWRYPRLGRWIDGKPQMLIQQGQLRPDVMRAERLTLDDVQATPLRFAAMSYTAQDILNNCSGPTVK